MKSEIIRIANRLCELLEMCDDEEFIDMVCSSVFSNSYICIDEYDEETDDVHSEREEEP